MLLDRPVVVLRELVAPRYELDIVWKGRDPRRAFRSLRLDAIQYSGLSGTEDTGADSKSAIESQAPCRSSR